MPASAHLQSHVAERNSHGEGQQRNDFGGGGRGGERRWSARKQRIPTSWSLEYVGSIYYRDSTLTWNLVMATGQFVRLGLSECFNDRQPVGLSVIGRTSHSFALSTVPRILFSFACRTFLLKQRGVDASCSFGLFSRFSHSFQSPLFPQGTRSPPSYRLVENVSDALFNIERKSRRT